MEELLYVNSSVRTRVSVDQIFRDCELEISGILLTVDLRVMDMFEFDVILGMDWLMVHRVVIDYDHRRVTTYTSDDVCVMFQGDKHDVMPQAIYDSRWHGQLMGWLIRLTFDIPENRDLCERWRLPLTILRPASSACS